MSSRRDRLGNRSREALVYVFDGCDESRWRKERWYRVAKALSHELRYWSIHLIIVLVYNYIFSSN
jgi:hypothetical protein